jgi:hypothetical protein
MSPIFAALHDRAGMSYAGIYALSGARRLRGHRVRAGGAARGAAADTVRCGALRGRVKHGGWGRLAAKEAP